MDTLGKRLAYYIEKQGKSTRQWALESGIAYNNLTQILRDEKALGMNVLLQVKQAIPDIDVNWLLFGEEHRSVSQNENILKPAQVNESSAEYEVSDPLTELLLRYLDRAAVKDKVREIIFGNEDLARKEFEALSDSPNFTVNLDELSRKSPQEYRRLMQKVENWNKEDSK